MKNKQIEIMAVVEIIDGQVTAAEKKKVAARQRGAHISEFGHASEIAALLELQAKLLERNSQ